MHAAIIFSLLLLTQAKSTPPDPAPLAEYFRIETARIARDPLLGIKTADEWKARRPALQRQFKEMLGLEPEPPRGPLNARVHGTIERPDFVIEKLTYESSPGLIVTGNLYRPKKVEHPLPAILYVCGHSQVEKDGAVLGAKTHYQHHAAWYASNGYVCLIVDTLQLGELPGLHHGTHRAGLWWWQTRGYTPAGVEAWNAVRGIDYLISRPEVDKNRLGVTGRSGGGATSWWVAAIDDRIKVAIPVAGITDLTNHVVDGVVQGHCDCMFHINTYRWDFNLVAALAAPKALLVENTDKDPIFPEDGVRRIYKTLEQVYEWDGVREKLDLVIGKGGHMDTTELRHPSFAFMNKWLKGDKGQIDEPDRKTPDELLRVLDIADEPRSRNATIFEDFVPPAAASPVFSTEEEWKTVSNRWRNEIRSKVLNGWPNTLGGADLDLKTIADVNVDGFRILTFEFQSQPGVRLRVWTIGRNTRNESKGLRLVVNDEANWKSTWSQIAKVAGGQGHIMAGNGSPAWQQARNEILGGATLAFFAPRGVGPTSWPADKDTHVRRRFALLGQTLDGMRAFDVARAAVATKDATGLTGELTMEGYADGEASTWLLIASVMTPVMRQVTLVDPPTSFRQSPAYLNLARIVEIPNLVSLSQAEHLRIETSTQAAWAWPLALQDRLPIPKRVEVIPRP